MPMLSSASLEADSGVLHPSLCPSANKQGSLQLLASFARTLVVCLMYVCAIALKAVLLLCRTMAAFLKKKQRWSFLSASRWTISLKVVHDGIKLASPLAKRRGEVLA